MQSLIDVPYTLHGSTCFKNATFSLNDILPHNSTLLCGQVVSIGGRNRPVSHPKYLTHQTSPGSIYVKSGK